MKYLRIVPIICIAFCVMLPGCVPFPKNGSTFDNISITSENSDRIEQGVTEGRLSDSSEELQFSSVPEARAAKGIVAVPSGYSIVAKVAAPFDAANPDLILGATHVFISKDYAKAYVTYNLAGNDRHGAIDIIDISTPTSPALVQSLLFKDTDINAIFVYKYGTGGYMYIAGSMAGSKLAQLSSRKPESFISKNATLERYTVKSDGTVDITKTYSKLTNLPGYQTTSVFQTYAPSPNYIFVTSGDDPTAGLTKLDYYNFPNILGQDIYDNAKYLDVELDRALTGNYSKYVSLEGGRSTSGTLHVYTIGKTDETAHLKIDIGEVDTQETRNTVDLYKNIAYAALGAAGMKAWDITKAPEKTPLYMMTKTDAASEIICNSVASDGTNVYMAMGAGGLWIAPVSSADGEGNLAAFEAVRFGSSANFVQCDIASGLIFVAGGTDGLKIISSAR